MTTARYRRRPAEVEAIRFDGTNYAEIVEFLGGPRQAKAEPTKLPGPGRGMHDGVAIHTLGRRMTASVGDWITRGALGELDTCPDDVFQAMYEPAGDAPVCSAALLPPGSAPAEPCITRGAHKQHQNAAGEMWIDVVVEDQAGFFVPPVAEGLPPAALDSATAGAAALDAWARDSLGRNFLAHALVQLARDGWLRAEPAEGFEPVRDREATPKPEEPPAAVSSAPDARAAALPPVCDGCGHPAHVAGHCPVTAYGERCLCDEPLNPTDGDRSDIRDRIADAPYAHDHPGWQVPLGESDVEPVYRERAAAVLADRAAVLREAAEIVRSMDSDYALQEAAEHLDGLAVEAHEEREAQANLDALVPLAGLRRMADEAQSAGPNTGDQIDTLARLLCDANVHVNNGDYPGWDDLSKTPGLGQDEVRKAARYLLARLNITARTEAQQDGVMS